MFRKVGWDFSMVPNFVEHLSDGGGLPALIFPDRAVITYDGLARRVANLAASFGDEKRLIAIEASFSEHAVIAYLAALAGGHAVALLPSGDTRAAAGFEGKYRPDICFRRIGERWRTDFSTHLSPETLHPDLALLLSTSGSTGQCKFVRLSGSNVEANADSIARFLHLECNDRGALILPLHYSYGLSVLNSHLAAHASLFVPRNSILDPGFVEDLRENRCTNIPGVPYSFELFEQIGLRQERLPNLRMMTVAGGGLPADLVRLYGSHLSQHGGKLFVMYGQTEATARMAYVPPHVVVENPDSIGIAIPGGELGLVDEYGMVIHETEAPGELIYSGPNIMMGYTSNRSDLSRGAELTQLKTGDLAIRDKHGFYRIVGRRSRISKIAGLRIGHDALEQALSLQGIHAAVLGDDQSSEDAVRNALIQASGLTALHVRASRQEILPRLPSGKVDYEQLRTCFGQHQTCNAQSVREAFREAFFPLTVADKDTFVSLGGDSLRYVRLSLGLEHVLHHLPENWENRPIAELYHGTGQDRHADREYGSADPYAGNPLRRRSARNPVANSRRCRRHGHADRLQSCPLPERQFAFRQTHRFFPARHNCSCALLSDYCRLWHYLGQGTVGVSATRRQLRFRRSCRQNDAAVPVLVHRSLCPDDADMGGNIRRSGCPENC